ncbi:MAG: hypothetical protein FJW40_19470 [Acidobacteria bacterium]|nr:hypothetical protein [Acidobacteriota bacterium]
MSHRIPALAAALVLGASSITAGEKTMMHCFAFTPIDTATEAEWDAFYKATDALPSTMSQYIKRVWFGKLRAPLNIFNPDAESRKVAMSGQKDTPGKITHLQRKHGVCMEMLGGPDSLKAYAADPAHKTWLAAYEKVRVAGTTTYDILGQ